MPSKIENILRKHAWEANKRAVNSGQVEDHARVKEARDLHISGRYEEALALIDDMPEDYRPHVAWRMRGHALNGMSRLDEAAQSHVKARNMAPSALEKVNDEVNLASVYIRMENYEDAWAAAERALQLSPGHLFPTIVQISILNRQIRHAELRELLGRLIESHPSVVNDSVFQDHLENDTDFIGVAAMMSDVKRSLKEK